MGLDTVQRTKQLLNSNIVRFLRVGNAAFIYAVVDVGILPAIDLINLFPEGLGIERDAPITWVNDAVKLAIDQHSRNISLKPTPCPTTRHVPRCPACEGFRCFHC
jgi:hypothetical protein